MVYDTSDPKEIEAAEERERIASEQERADWKWLMETPHGRRVAYRMLSRCHVYHSSLPDGGGINNSWVLVYEGERRVGLWLMGKIQDVSGEDYLTMLAEGLEYGEGDTE